MQSQKQSVYAAVCSVLAIGDVNELVKLTKEQRGAVIEMVTTSIIDGSTEFSAEAKVKYATRDDVKGYVNGMVSNWLRKDTRLNGGAKYETKNPGSRAGSGDEVLKNLKALRAQHPEHAEAIDVEITKRIAEIAATKAKTVTIDIDKIPEGLRHLIPA